MPLLSRLLRAQIVLSEKLDSFLPPRFRIDGHSNFRASFVPPYLLPGMSVWDVGGGRCPLITPELKAAMRLKITGFDLSPKELAAAPAGSYDRTIVGDITGYGGSGDADLVICQALLEHIPDTQAALRAIASVLRPGGVALIFVPCRNSAFARLNLLLPHGLKTMLLRVLHRRAEGTQGFPVYYDRCTPRSFRRMAARSGLNVTACRTYYASSYFRPVFPVYLLWRACMLLAALIAPERFAETFSMALHRPESAFEPDSEFANAAACQEDLLA